MKLSAKRVFAGVGICVIALAAIASYQAQAFQTNNKPAVVVTVNLSAVLEKLDQRAAAETNLRQIFDNTLKEKEAKETAIKKMEAELKDMADGPEKRAKEDAYILAVRQFEAWAAFTEDKIDIEKALLYHDLYRSIKAAAAELAAAAGYDIVLVDDSQGELSTSAQVRASRQAQILQQIAARRMLYANPRIDITDDLVSRMNNSFKAAKAP